MNNAARGAPPDAVVRQAIAWWTRLQSGVANARDHESCRAWLDADAAHRQAWDRLEAIGRDTRRVPAALAHAALSSPSSRGRRNALRGLLSLTGVAAIGWAGYRHTPWQRLAADLSTRVGERRTVALADGLTITLNSDSAVRLHLSGAARGIDLLRGEMLVNTQPRAGVDALRVIAGDGELRAERARFDLHRTSAGLRLGVYEGSVGLLRQGAWTHADAGERLAYTDPDAGADELVRSAVDPDRLAWVDGMVVAKEWRLDAFARYLARQRVGVIRVDPGVAALTLSGVFPLDDAERALKALEPALPITVTRHTQYWLQVDPRQI
ncbi:iron dicitrate transport regulator FecR [Achromobacter spanius]|uniref:Iron dicitrate transport regulator FecR n=1 Tax=Achromobacter spanius TaxID=217203 RepID=A0A2S5GUG2_9BURK|nr:FecR domain-containing protein [Achromobacter spanius]PPA76727.1 iron dicitrate transport regulator FecR [Achromobacter spanius]